MEDVNDADLKRERLGSYGHVPPSAHRMPPSETPPGLHDYSSHPPGPGMPQPWNPSPSPYDSGDHRAPPPAIPHQPSYPPHSSYPPPGREPQPRYGPDLAYSRPGSVSAPTRSPPNAPPPQYHAVNGAAPEGPYYQGHGPPDYRSQHSYGPPLETPTNGTHQQPGLHLATGPEMMSGQPSGPPSGQYGPPSAGGPQTPAFPFYSDFYAGQRRKPVRAAQACDACRTRKAKCDEGRPECQHCKDNNLKCSYREVPPQKQEKQVIAITEKLENMERQLAGQDERMERMLNIQEDKMEKMLNAQREEMRNLMHSLVPADARINHEIARRDTSSSTTVPLKREHSLPSGGVPTNQNQSFASAPDHDVEDSNFPVSTEFALPPKHTTAAQNLLRWPAVRSLIPPNHNDSYVMDLESTRGLLRLYGCGEGEDKNDGGEGAPSPAGSSSSGSRHDDETSNPSPGGVWGIGHIQAPSPGQHASPRDHPGGVSPNGGLILESEVVDRHYKSYIDNMHILHPFLEAKVIRQMVHLFKRRYSWDYRAMPKVPSAIGKRKRESDSPSSVHDIPVLRHHGRYPNSPVSIEHSVANAIVLLVIALGSICSHKADLPGAPSPSAMPTSTPQNTGQSTYSDLPMSQPMSLSAPTSPFNQGSTKSGAPGMAVPGPTNPQGKNMDVIPGLGYFAKAADILGELPGGSDVSHIQANLLAGLYMGQLARVFPSHYYISNACKACMVLIESTDYKAKRMTQARRNLINFAFWSCLQLESDILAEVELPPSGVTRFEGAMRLEMPTGLTLDEEEARDDPKQDILRFYSYQVQLRRTLNDIHTTLYAQGPTVIKPSFRIIQILDESLENWRQCLGTWNWDDNDHKSKDVNVARMRGKYYGAKYIIFRQALYHALLQTTITTPNNRHSESPNAATFYSQLQSPATQGVHRHGAAGSEMGPPTRSSNQMDPRIREAAAKCIAAAIRSTTVFDGVEGRLIITNIFGTAHAQFGNVVVLAATYTHKDLHTLIPKATLLQLMDRTICFLNRSKDISPVLKYDAEILSTMKANLFPEIPSPDGSFSER